VTGERRKIERQEQWSKNGMETKNRKTKKQRMDRCLTGNEANHFGSSERKPAIV
jgi:hypothetical protein